jgi:hypothetical protein
MGARSEREWVRVIAEEQISKRASEGARVIEHMEMERLNGHAAANWPRMAQQNSLRPWSVRAISSVYLKHAENRDMASLSALLIANPAVLWADVASLWEAYRPEAVPELPGREVVWKAVAELEKAPARARKEAKAGLS